MELAPAGKPYRYTDTRDAINLFRSAGFRPGDLIVTDWLEIAVGIEQSSNSLEFFKRFDSFRKTLLIDYKVALENVRSRGYRWVPSREQAEYGADTALKGIIRSLNTGRIIVDNTDLNNLSTSEKRKSFNASAKLAGLSSMINRQRKNFLE